MSWECHHLAEKMRELYFVIRQFKEVFFNLQAKSPKRDVAPKKRNFLRNHLKKSDEVDKEIIMINKSERSDSSTKISSVVDKKSNQPILEPQVWI